MTAAVAARVRCRQIEKQDLGAIAVLLSKGFPARPLAEWQSGLKKLSSHRTPDGYPKFGFMLETDQGPAGVLLTICTELESDGVPYVRCNFSSWYLEPAFRAYASLLTSRAQKYAGVTYINTSPADHTWPLVEAQGFKRFTGGTFVGAMARPTFNKKSQKVHIFEEGSAVRMGLSSQEGRMLDDCQSYGCLCLCVETQSGAVLPFVFRRRVIFLNKLPAVHLIYCRNIGDVSEAAPAICRFLLHRGIPLMTAAVNAPIAGIMGKYFPNRRPMYYKGLIKPRAGDLRYTENAMFGM